MIPDHLGGPVGRALARGIDGGRGLILIGPFDFVALGRQFRDPRPDLVGPVAEPRHRGFLIDEKGRGFKLEHPHPDAVDSLDMVDLDLRPLGLHCRLLLEGLGIQRLK